MFAPGRALIYSIASVPGVEIGASFEGDELKVVVPTAIAHAWIETDQIGIEGPRVLIEKDFQCLHRPNSEDPDGFPNPLAANQ